MEIENLHTFQESLARQMPGCTISKGDGNALFSSNKKNSSKDKDNGRNFKNHGNSKHSDGESPGKSDVNRRVSSVTDVVNLGT